MSDTSPPYVSSPEQEPHHIPRDHAWAHLVKLYPEEFSQSEVLEAQKILDQHNDPSWIELNEGIDLLRQQSNYYEPHFDGPMGLESQSRENLMKLAVNIAESNAESQRQNSNSLSTNHTSRLIIWLQPLSWAMLFGLAMVGLWSYQSQIEPDQEPIWTSTPNTEPSSLNPFPNVIPSIKNTDDQSTPSTQKEEIVNIEERTEENSPYTSPIEVKPTIQKANSSKSLSRKGRRIASKRSARKRKSRAKYKRERKQYKKSKKTVGRRKITTQKSSMAKSRVSKPKRVERRTKTQTAPVKRRPSSPYLDDNLPSPIPAALPPSSYTSSEARSDQRPSVSQFARGQQALTNVKNILDIETEQNSPEMDDQISDTKPPTPPWQKSIRLWADGQRTKALNELIIWINQNSSHSQRKTAIRLGLSWAKNLNNKSALNELKILQGRSK